LDFAVASPFHPSNIADMTSFADAAPHWAQLSPEWGIVLGSGMGLLVENLEIEDELDYRAVPGIPHSSVPGHQGRFLLGRLAGRRIVAAQGRTHLYEGRSVQEVTAGVRFMAALGVRRLILTNAAGSLNAGFHPGSWMMISDHLNLTGTSPLMGGPHFVDMTEVYSRSLRERFADAARAEGLPLGEGVYAGLLGPQYETPAEVRMLGLLGADAVGMSTVLESIQARALGLEVAGFSCLTNWAAGLGIAPLSHSEVLETGRAAAEVLVRLLGCVLEGDAMGAA
jgi:purine-nucleoside phosphorylase